MAWDISILYNNMPPPLDLSKTIKTSWSFTNLNCTGKISFIFPKLYEFQL